MSRLPSARAKGEVAVEAWITPLVIGVVTIILTWSAQHGRPAPGPDEGTLLFRYGTAARVIMALLGFGFLGLVLLITFTARRQPEDIWAVPLLYALSLLTFAPLWETVRFALIVSPEGLDCRSAWRKRQLFLWEELVEVRFGWVNENFILRTTDGRTFRVHAYVPGVSDLLAECERHLPPSAFRRAKAGYDRVGRPFPEADQEAAPSTS